MSEYARARLIHGDRESHVGEPEWGGIMELYAHFVRLEKRVEFLYWHLGVRDS